MKTFAATLATLSLAHLALASPLASPDGLHKNVARQAISPNMKTWYLYAIDSVEVVRPIRLLADGSLYFNTLPKENLNITEPPAPFRVPTDVTPFSITLPSDSEAPDYFHHVHSSQSGVLSTMAEYSTGETDHLFELLDFEEGYALAAPGWKELRLPATLGRPVTFSCFPVANLGGGTGVAAGDGSEYEQESEIYIHSVVSGDLLDPSAFCQVGLEVRILAVEEPL